MTVLTLLLAACRPADECAEGMVPVPVVAGAPPRCIDAYEVTVAGTPGSRDDPGSRSGAVARSAPGVVPAIGISYSQAVAICAATPVVHPRTGAVVGNKHLATAEEWQDAGDGIAGPGGPRYPWGDELGPPRCALAPRQGPLTTTATALTGSYPGCVGPTGAYDLIGNLWEWVDSGIPMDSKRWLAAATGVVLDGDVLRVTNAAHLRAYSLTVPNLTGHLEAGPGMELIFVADQPSARRAPGYLINDAARSLPDRQAPVDLSAIDGAPGRFRVRLERSLDGTNFPDKRGGAWYAGGDFDLTKSSFQHVPNFIGTIGFRCAGPSLLL